MTIAMILLTLAFPGAEPVETLALLPAFTAAADIDPGGMLYDSGRYFVSDIKGNQILVFDSREKPLGRFGSIGTGPGDFLRPGPLLAGPGGRLYVVEYGNQRVQILDRDRKPSGMIELPAPTNAYQGFAIDRQGNVLAGRLSDNTIIQRFSPNGNKLKGWGAPHLPSAVLGPSAASLGKEYHKTFNRAALSADSTQDSLYACFVFAPLVQKYGADGVLLWQKKLEGSVLHQLSENFAQGKRASFHGVYDGLVASNVTITCAFDPEERFLYVLLPTAQMWILDYQGNQVRKVALKPAPGNETSRLFIPINLLAHKGSLHFSDLFVKRIWKYESSW